jgi:hypothetical protein
MELMVKQMNIDATKLKQLLKPVVKSLIRECLLEEGVLSSIISETIIGVRKSEVLVETSQPTKQIPQFKTPKEQPRRRGEHLDEDFKKFMNEGRERNTQEILNKTGISKVFENLQPIPADSRALTTESAQKAPTSFQASANKSGTALRNVDPNDPGVNINGILNLIGGKDTWKTFLK